MIPAGLAIHDVDTIATALHLFGEVARTFDGRMICDGAQTFRVSDPGVGHVDMECICASLAHSFHQSFRACVFFGVVVLGCDLVDCPAILGRDRKSTRRNSSHKCAYLMPSSDCTHNKEQ